MRATLKTFATAVEKRQYGRICEDVFAPELLRGLQQIGLPCEAALRTSLGQVREPRLTVGEVTVKGTTARAEVRTAAANQAPSTDTLELTRRKGAWRVSALGGEAQASPSPSRTPSPTASP